MSSLGIPPGAVAVTLINSGRCRSCNCNPRLILPETLLVDCNHVVAYGVVPVRSEEPLVVDTLPPESYTYYILPEYSM